MPIKIKVHTESKDRKPWDIELEIDVDTVAEMLENFNESMKNKEYREIYQRFIDSLSSSLIPALITYINSRPTGGKQWSGPQYGMPIGSFSMPPMDPELLGKFLEHISSQIPKSPPFSQAAQQPSPDIFAKDKAEPPGYYKPTKNLEKVIKNVAKEKSKEIKIGDAIKEEADRKAKLLEEAKKRVNELNKPIMTKKDEKFLKDMADTTEKYLKDDASK